MVSVYVLGFLLRDAICHMLVWQISMNASKYVCIRFSLGIVGQSPYKIGGDSMGFVDSHSDLGVNIEKSQKLYNHNRKLAGMYIGITTNIFASTLCRDPEFLMNIYHLILGER